MDIKEKLNGFFAKLPFNALAEKIPAETRAKVPALNKAIPFANQIVCGAVVLLVVVIIGFAGGGSSSGRAKLGNFPAEYPIAYLGLATKERSVQDLFGPDAVFATKYMGMPCRVIIESSSGKGSEFTATLLLKAQNSSGKEVDVFRLEVEFHANDMEEVSYIRYIKLDSLMAGESAEYSSTGDPYDEGEMHGVFAYMIDYFWFFSIVPKEMMGRWVRKGANYDTTIIFSADTDNVEYKRSDGQSYTATIDKVTAEINSNADTKDEYPSGWKIVFTVTENSLSGIKIGDRYGDTYYFNAKKNKCNQNGKNPTNIFVKQ